MRRLISLVITFVIIGTLLLGIPPAAALKIGISDPTPKRLGKTIKFSITVEVEDRELLPVQRVDLEIYNKDKPETYALTCSKLPLVSAFRRYSTVEVEAIPAVGWGYGYGHRYARWKGYGYYWGYGYGYGGYGYGYIPQVGYGYGYGLVPTSITYDIRWHSPLTWPAGDYVIKATIVANGETFSKTRTVYLSPPIKPTVTTKPATDITTSSARLRMDYTLGDYKSVDVYFQYRVMGVLEWSKTPKVVKTVSGSFSSTVTGLSPATTYEFRGAADYAGGTVYGCILAFTTPPLLPPRYAVSISMSPKYQSGRPGKELTFDVTVVNKGNVKDSYRLTAEDTRGWLFKIAPEKLTISAGKSKGARLKVTIPKGTENCVEDFITVTATSVTKPEVKDSDTAVAHSKVPPPPIIPWWVIVAIIVAIVIAASVGVWYWRRLRS